MPQEILRAHLLTRGAYYRGNLHYSDVPGASRPRLLDFLNSRARARSLADQRTTGVLRLDDADVTLYHGSAKLGLTCPTLNVTLTAVVIAFDETPPGRPTSMPPPSYEQRMAQQKLPVVVVTRTRHRLHGLVRGGIKRLGVRTPDELFVALTDVTIEDLSVDDRQPAQLSFVALNMDFVEAFWSADPTAT